MNIVVCMKQTFDTEEKVVIREGKISEDGVKFVINPYDEYALEEAIRLKEKFGGEVTAVSVGPDRAEEALRTALAMGADKGVLVNDPDLFGDEYTAAKVLAAVLKTIPFDIILGGNLAVDSGAGQVAVRLAEELGIPHIATIVELDIEGDRVVAKREADGDIEVVEARLPLLVTAQQGLNEPRYPSLPGIMKAKKKPLDRRTAADLGISAAEVAAKSSLVELLPPPPKNAGKRLEGDPREQVSQLVHLLRNEAKVL